MDNLTAQAFNDRFPVGSQFIYQPIAAARGGRIAVTRSEAWTLGHGEVVVKIEGRAGGVAISHLTPA